jgi:hypothetical protein
MMANDYIVVDTVAIQNLFAGGGTTAWGQLLTDGKKVVFSSVIRDELRSAPGDIARVFENWAAASGVQVVEFELSDLRRPDNSLKTDAGDKTLRALMDPNNADAQAAMRAAGIDANGTFRLLTDDAGFLKKIWNTTGFDDASLLAEGHTHQPYRGTLEFMAERYANGEIDRAGMSAWLDNFAASGRSLSLGVDDGAGGKQFKLLDQFNAVYLDKDAFLDGDILDALRDTRLNVLGDQAGYVSVKGGILLGAFGLAAKFGIIGDVLAFAMTASTADELRSQGKVSEANKLWTAYLFETSGGILGGVLGGFLVTRITKGKGGPVPIIVGALLGSVAGSLAGAPLGEFLYDQHPEIFDPLLNNIYDGLEGVTFDENFAFSVAKKLGFTLEASEGSAQDDWFLSTKWTRIDGREGDDILINWDPEVLQIGEAYDRAIRESERQALAVYESLKKLGYDPPLPERDPTAERATSLEQAKIDGGEGDDYIFANDGDRAVTIGGLGRDWIYNTSAGGIIWGGY